MNFENDWDNRSTIKPQTLDGHEDAARAENETEVTRPRTTLGDEQ
jgi:hypothetical protein